MNPPCIRCRHILKRPVGGGAVFFCENSACSSQTYNIKLLKGTRDLLYQTTTRGVRGPYRCQFCKVPKKGHVCPYTVQHDGGGFLTQEDRDDVLEGLNALRAQGDDASTQGDAACAQAVALGQIGNADDAGVVNDLILNASDMLALICAQPYAAEPDGAEDAQPLLGARSSQNMVVEQRQGAQEALEAQDAASAALNSAVWAQAKMAERAAFVIKLPPKKLLTEGRFVLESGDHVTVKKKHGWLSMRGMFYARAYDYTMGTLRFDFVSKQDRKSTFEHATALCNAIVYFRVKGGWRYFAFRVDHTVTFDHLIFCANCRFKINMDKVARLMDYKATNREKALIVDHIRKYQHR